MTENEEVWNETEELKNLLDDYKKVTKIFFEITKIKPNDVNSIEKIERFYKTFPQQSDLANALDELNIRTKSYIEKAKINRKLSFNKIMTQFIKNLQNTNVPLKEFSNTWRIGPLEFDSDYVNSRIRYLYNHQIVINWKPIKNPEDIEKYRNDALKSLENSLIENDILVTIFHEAFNNIKIKNNTTLVPIKDFFREIRVVYIRHQLINKEPDSKMLKIDFPMWAFLYNTDHYISISSKLPSTERLIFQTGSLKEVSRGMGVFLKGLDPYREYENFCYVTINRGQ